MTAGADGWELGVGWFTRRDGGGVVPSRESATSLRTFPVPLKDQDRHESDNDEINNDEAISVARLSPRLASAAPVTPL